MSKGWRLTIHKCNGYHWLVVLKSAIHFNESLSISVSCITMEIVATVQDFQAEGVPENCLCHHWTNVFLFY